MNTPRDREEDQNFSAETRRAMLNLLEDSAEERANLQRMQRAMLNILADFESEAGNFRDVQRATLNVLEDFDLEKSKVEMLNQELRQQVTERRRAQEQVKKLNEELEQRVEQRTADLMASNRELEAFSYSASHDLRAPLRAIDGFCQVLSEEYAEKMDAEGRGLLLRVRAASQRLDRLIDGILGLARTTRTVMSRTKVDMSALAESIALDLRKEDPGRRVEFAISPGLVAQADANLLRIVLENLLSNAWKFTSKHEQARIELGETPHEEENAYYVRDDGAGFEMTYAGKLFTAFERLHQPAEFEGTGIGLATVQRIIHRHGGRVWAKGEVEKGATFFFTIPRNRR